MLLLPEKYMRESTSYWFDARFEKGKFGTRTIQSY